MPDSQTRHSHASTMSLVGGVLALDFANTGSTRDGDGEVEHLQEPLDLVDWAHHAGAVDTATADRLRSAVAAGDGSGGKLLRHARELRGAIYAAGSAIAGQRAPADAHLRTVKAFAGKAMGESTLTLRSTGNYAFDFLGAEPETALLGPIAWSALDLLSARPLERVKQCPECGWLFFDHSKNNSRRWCDMATCGNRIKLRRHRQRR